MAKVEKKNVRTIIIIIAIIIVVVVYLVYCYISGNWDVKDSATVISLGTIVSLMTLIFEVWQSDSAKSLAQQANKTAQESALAQEGIKNEINEIKLEYRNYKENLTRKEIREYLFPFSGILNSIKDKLSNANCKKINIKKEISDLENYWRINNSFIEDVVRLDIKEKLEFRRKVLILSSDSPKTNNEEKLNMANELLLQIANISAKVSINCVKNVNME